MVRFYHSSLLVMLFSASSAFATTEAQSVTTSSQEAPELVQSEPAQPTEETTTETLTPEATPPKPLFDRDALKAELQKEIMQELESQRKKEEEQQKIYSSEKEEEALKWTAEDWSSEPEHSLGLVELDGYFRLRFDIFNRLDLGTYDPTFSYADGRRGRGTSSVPPPTRYFPFNGFEGCADDDEIPNQPDAYPGQTCENSNSGTNRLSSMNMRFRLNPTIHVSDDIKIHTTIDTLDNLVLGSTPASQRNLLSFQSNPGELFAETAVPLQQGLNSEWDSIRVKRAWAEVMLPVGRLKFGRMPQNWGLGIMRNSGDGLDQDYGDVGDQIEFETKLGESQASFAYQIVSSGAYGRGGGAGLGADRTAANFSYAAPYGIFEQGQRYNLDPSDDVHSLTFTWLKKHEEEEFNQRRKEGVTLVDYGFLGEYRSQDYATPLWSQSGSPTTPPTVLDVVRRNANAGLGSFWLHFGKDNFTAELEAIAILGRISNTGGANDIGAGLNAADPYLQTVDGPQALTVFQTGLAVETDFRFVDEKLKLGVDFGYASGDDAPGFGLRPQTNATPETGDFDGLQYGECLATNADGDCTDRDTTVNNYRFDPDYIVDMILYREILGTVTDSVYFKPHLEYDVSQNLGTRFDVIYSHGIFKNSTPGFKNSLGLEIDGSIYFASDDGFYFMFQGGMLFPMGGLDHARDPDNADIGLTYLNGGSVDPAFLNAKFAYTLQTFAGIRF